jgi:hypothetical protein
LHGKRTLFVTVGIAFVTLGSVSITTYAAPFLRTPQAVVTPSYRVVERPTEAPNTVETLTEEFSDEEYYADEDYDYIGENGCNVLGLTIR